MSYCEYITYSVLTDTCVGEEPHEIVKRFDDAINKYIELGKKKLAERDAIEKKTSTVSTDNDKPSEAKTEKAPVATEAKATEEPAAIESKTAEVPVVNEQKADESNKQEPKPDEVKLEEKQEA